MSDRSFGMQELEVALRIRDGKLVAESRSGPKSGEIQLAVEGNTARLTLAGAGDDRATATLTGPELSHFRTLVDAGLSSMDLDRSAVEGDQRVLYSGYQSLERRGEEYVATLDGDALARLGLLDESGGLAGGGRQVRCTVLNSGTAMLNLLTESESPFVF